MNRYVREGINIFLIVLGIFSAAFGIKGFLLSSRFIDGGVTGVSMLISEVAHLPLSIPLVLINLPFIALGYRQVGKMFAFKSALAIAGLAIVLAVVSFPNVTPDKLLTAVFGGFFIGAGIGLAIRGGAVLDGTEIAALLISKKSSILKVADVILILNILIFVAAAFFLSVESALYSILTYFAASKTIDFLLYGIEEYHAVTIISDSHEPIKNSIVKGLGRSVTVYKGQGGISDTERDILYVVVTRLEIGEIKNAVKNIDPHAFIIVHNLSDVEGGLLKRSDFH
ncbi:MAG: YitT family protein [Acidobacteriota bacterium]|nr:YitT family protein [Acidobacteriota bacterium]